MFHPRPDEVLEVYSQKDIQGNPEIKDRFVREAEQMLPVLRSGGFRVVEDYVKDKVYVLLNHLKEADAEKVASLQGEIRGLEYILTLREAVEVKLESVRNSEKTLMEKIRGIF